MYTIESCWKKFPVPCTVTIKTHESLITKCGKKRRGLSPPFFSLLFLPVFFCSPGPLAAVDKTHTEMFPFRQLSVSKCCSSSFTGLKRWMDMFLTGVCLRGTLVILSSAENNRVMLSTKVRMRGRQGKQLRPGCWKCCYSCQLYETIHPPILCPDSPFELQNNDLTQVPTGKATSQRRTERRRCSGWGRGKKKIEVSDGKSLCDESRWRPTTYAVFRWKLTTSTQLHDHGWSKLAETFVFFVFFLLLGQGQKKNKNKNKDLLKQRTTHTCW